MGSGWSPPKSGSGAPWRIRTSPHAGGTSSFMSPFAAPWSASRHDPEGSRRRAVDGDAAPQPLEVVGEEIHRLDASAAGGRGPAGGTRSSAASTRAVNSGVADPPNEPLSLIPLKRAGLWLAVTTRPPAAPRAITL